jgi:hypothetical protein
MLEHDVHILSDLRDLLLRQFGDEINQVGYSVFGIEKQSSGQTSNKLSQHEYSPPTKKLDTIGPLASIMHIIFYTANSSFRSGVRPTAMLAGTTIFKELL